MNWIIPCNIRYFDVIGAFKNNNMLCWKQIVNINVGDIIYIYVGKPYQRLMYQCLVLDVDLKYSCIDDSKFQIDNTVYKNSERYMKIQLLSTNESKKLSLKELNIIGIIDRIYSPRKLFPNQVLYIDSVFDNFNIEHIDLTIDDVSFVEGKEKLRQHIIRERNQELIKKAKEKFKAEHDGKLFCEICGFDFFEVYGELGEGFIEAHHTKPISEMVEGEKTNIDDISMVCSNCHSMVHRRKPWMTKNDLKRLIYNDSHG